MSDAYSIAAQGNAQFVDGTLQQLESPYFKRNLRYVSAVDSIGRLRFACITESTSNE